MPKLFLYLMCQINKVLFCSDFLIKRTIKSQSGVKKIQALGQNIIQVSEEKSTSSFIRKVSETSQSTFLRMILILFKNRKKVLQYFVINQKETVQRMNNTLEKANSPSLTKLQISEHFSQIFEDEANVKCFECGKKSKQWAQTQHAIFLCLGCAAQYKDLKKYVNIKSISLDLWSQEEMILLKYGGNAKFSNFLDQFDLKKEGHHTFLRTRAAEYYRKMLLVKQKGGEIPPEPSSFEQGQQIIKIEVPITEMTSDEILQEAKEKIYWFGDKTKKIGAQAYGKVHHKITSGELKKDAKKAAEKVSETAKGIWGFIKTKIEQVQKKQQKVEDREKDDDSHF